MTNLASNSYLFKLYNNLEIYYPKNAFLNGLILDDCITNELNLDTPIYKFKEGDYIFTPWIDTSSILKEDYKIDGISINDDFYKIISIIYIKGKLKDNFISLRLNKKHLEYKKDLFLFFKENNIEIETKEYPDFFYFTIYNLQLFSILQSLKNPTYENLNQLFNTYFIHKNSFIFIENLIYLTNNNLNINEYCFLEFYKKICYSKKCVVYLNNNSIKHSYKFSLSFYKENEINELLILDSGYLVKIKEIKLSHLTPEYTLKEDYQNLVI